MKIIITAFVLVTFFLLSPYPADAEKPVPLPIVTLLNSAGEQVTTEGFGKEQGNVIILVRKGNPGGIKMLDFLAGLEPQFPADRLLVVVSGGDERVFKAISGKYPRLVVSWYYDPDGSLAKKLELVVTPAVLGVHNATVAWKLLGLADQELLEMTMRGWLKR